MPLTRPPESMILGVPTEIQALQEFVAGHPDTTKNPHPQYPTILDEATGVEANLRLQIEANAFTTAASTGTQSTAVVFSQSFSAPPRVFAFMEYTPAVAAATYIINVFNVTSTGCTLVYANGVASKAVMARLICIGN